ncbi:MAG: peptidase U32 family protein [Pseudanabaenaceae cyanobacterium]
MKRPELLAPAGDWECAKAAVENGADAIYFGVEQFNARLRAANFTAADLPELLAFLHGRGVKGYLTLNTLIFTEELPAVETLLRTAIAAGIDAFIVQDVGLCRLIRHLSADVPIHASTQMTITSAAGVAFAQALGCALVVLARECSLKDIGKLQRDLQGRGLAMPLEIFIHGALCVSYSGQCLTSEALGGRSANRGECAQACRMPYELVVDGETRNVGDRHYLLSPQDLMGMPLLSEVVAAGLASLKIEGRLKSPEYVATTVRAYRQALDRVLGGQPPAIPRYELAMAFSRGLTTGWLGGINNQELVDGRCGRKRGVYLGTVEVIADRGVWVTLAAPVQAGDGIVFDRGQPQAQEEGGRVYRVQHRGDRTHLQFGAGDIHWGRVQPGDRLWKTSDPVWAKQAWQSYAQVNHRVPLTLTVMGEADTPLTVIAQDNRGHIVQVSSAMNLAIAQRQPLTTETLQQQLGRLGNTVFALERLDNRLVGDVILPLKELNRLRREVSDRLLAQRQQPPRWHLSTGTHPDLLPPPPPPSPAPPTLSVLVRREGQMVAAIASGVSRIYLEYEDPRRYREAVARFRAEAAPGQTVWLAPPRIAKPDERWILQQVQRANPDGYLVRNPDHLEFFAGAPLIGDFSFNVANPLSARYLQETYGVSYLTASYDLNLGQLVALLRYSAPLLEITIHQHIPLFHMEHCVFCAFLSEGTDFTNCGRPCEQHEAKLRDRAGVAHILHADAGCRNTLYNGMAQSGAEAIAPLWAAGARQFRVELLAEDEATAQQTIGLYQQLLAGEIPGKRVWQTLQITNQLGVTRGSWRHG